MAKRTDGEFAIGKWRQWKIVKEIYLKTILKRQKQ